VSKKIAVIGAGPAGLTAAYELTKKGFSVDVYEAGDSVGGMAKTILLWGQLVDLGSHRFFSSDPRVNKLWLEVIGRDYEMVNRLSRIYYKETFFDYPLKPFNALSGLGLFESIRCVISYVAAKISPPRNTSTFEGWVTSRFGSRLFQVFFKSYSEKLWGIPCDRLDADFAAQRIKKLSLFEAIKSAIVGNKGSKHKTLVDQFAYPKLGTGEVYDRMAVKISEAGGVVKLKASVASVHPVGPINTQPYLTMPDGSELTYDHVISTMPITHLVEHIGAPEDVRAHAKELTFRNTILIYLRVEGASPFPDQWIYVHSTILQTGRITNFRNWLPTINQDQPDTILCLEYWCYDQDANWAADNNELVKLATNEIYQTGLVPRKSVKGGQVIRIPRCYPVYASGYKQHLKPIEEFLSTQEGISVIGRYGSFKYNNQDHSILMGLLAAENIAEGAKHNLWELNTDDEYQESTKITATGLVDDRK
jgi:protoporphyrinogen oxidase